VLVPPIFNFAPEAMLSVPPATVVPLSAAKEESLRTPAEITILPSAAAVELRGGRFPASVFIVPPLIVSVEYVNALLTVWLIVEDA
jgi:hypothetical protein